MLTTRKIGQQSVWVATFRDDDQALIDPAVVTFLWQTPDGGESAYAFGSQSEVSRLSKGVFSFTSPPYAHSREHRVRVRAKSPSAAYEQVICVEKSGFLSP